MEFESFFNVTSLDSLIFCKQDDVSTNKMTNTPRRIYDVEQQSISTNPWWHSKQRIDYIASMKTAALIMFV